MAIIYKETKYLIFLAEQKKGHRTKSVYVINRSDKSTLAMIEWYPAWRQYIFNPTLEFDTVWNNTCLTDVISVINDLMKERQIDKPIGE